MSRPYVETSSKFSLFSGLWKLEAGRWKGRPSWNVRCTCTAVYVPEARRTPEKRQKNTRRHLSFIRYAAKFLPFTEVSGGYSYSKLSQVKLIEHIA